MIIFIVFLPMWNPSLWSLALISVLCSVTGTVWVKTTQLDSLAAWPKHLPCCWVMCCPMTVTIARRVCFCSVRVAGEVWSVYWKSARQSCPLKFYNKVCEWYQWKCNNFCSCFVKSRKLHSFLCLRSAFSEMILEFFSYIRRMKSRHTLSCNCWLFVIHIYRPVNDMSPLYVYCALVCFEVTMVPSDIEIASPFKALTR